MYIPPKFKITDDEINRGIINRHSFATLFSQHHGLPFATHLPLMLSEDHLSLYGHFARQNPQFEDIAGQNVLAVFHGPHCYISPSWYETNQAVPTWNYVTVHVFGEVELIGNGSELAKHLNDIVLKYEAPDSPYRLDQADSNFIDGMTRGVQGFRIKISKIEGKAKLSQNQPLQRQKRVIEQLEKSPNSDERQIASFMKSNLETRPANPALSE
ncbi:Protease synthase and sporulation protein PAI 2 [Bhargavaea cecembensis DSE10]|uniref:Protease synthase and sporulation protein PAI 2 n=1 Tax=Bhargavaea cecembensis DSE10 TaxID=1235279 RepID=M7NG91_9BACL|nr:FMN-binding negative transcriptional regulator [Bhargavaea cecembensis]EMR06201.1 Protease synthase and sporulation protein PAI 2 [Bhargavaea cecembensis DSE10]